MRTSYKICLFVLLLIVVAETLLTGLGISKHNVQWIVGASALFKNVRHASGVTVRDATSTQLTTQKIQIVDAVDRLVANVSGKISSLTSEDAKKLKADILERLQDILVRVMNRTKAGNRTTPLMQAGNRTEPKTKDKTLPWCSENPPGLVGVRASNRTDVSPEELVRKFLFLEPGGNYNPPDCKSVNRTAIIIPYRNRWGHLHVLLNNLVPFLVRQQLSFTIFVIELELPTTFNRAMLLNIGVLESLKRDNYTCFAFHDVDLVPLDDHNLYRCSSNPRHLAVAINKFNYNMPYGFYFGGASIMSRDQVFKINGNSNLYFGWGGEDDDLHYRILGKGMKPLRYPVKLARYDMIKHGEDKGNEANPLRSKLLQTAAKRMDQDGLSTVRYKVTSVEVKPLYTWIKVAVSLQEIVRNAPKEVLPIFKDVIAKGKV